MRMLSNLLGLTAAAVLIIGCASAPKEPEPDRAVPLDASNMVAAQKAGYKLVNENGRTLYCKRGMMTGTHARKETQCLTEAEWQEMRDTSRRSVETMRRTTPPKQDKRG
jgi:hypothetical protein